MPVATSAGFKIIDHSDGGRLRTIAELAGAVARARVGEGADAFLADDSALRNHISSLLDYAKASARLERAIRTGEIISVFGDYDVDGMTSLVLIYDLLKAAGHKSVRLYIPNRAVEDYGLTLPAVQNCVSLHSPTLVFSVDCGSNSIESINWLKSQGIDAIILDHHGVSVKGAHPAFAHLNPKGDDTTGPVVDDLRTLSAAGLAYLFVEEYARTHGLHLWSRDRAAVLGGLGTMVDVMPLRGTNRHLVKRSLRLARESKLSLVPGLAALAEAINVKEINSSTYGFALGPHLNAAGRLTSAQVSVKVLAASTAEGVKNEVAMLIETNSERKQMQDRIQRLAMVQADDLLTANPDLRILVLGDEDWNIGVVGIVAARIREATCRPTFVCGKTDDGFWKGSGRSTPECDLGAIVHRAVHDGALTSGGGHAKAAGIKMTNLQFEDFVRWIDRESASLPLEFTKTYEILGEAQILSFDDWMKLSTLLEPYGEGNYRCNVLLARATVVDGPRQLTKRDEGTVWGIEATVDSGGQRYRLLWTDLDRAQSVWNAGRTYRIVVNVSSSIGKNGRTYENWKVLDAEDIGKA